MPHLVRKRQTKERNRRTGKAKESKTTRSPTSSDFSNNDVGTETWYMEGCATKVTFSRPNPILKPAIDGQARDRQDLGAIGPKGSAKDAEEEKESDMLF
jgi:hypothetical protein